MSKKQLLFCAMEDPSSLRSDLRLYRSFEGWLQMKPYGFGSGGRADDTLPWAGS